MRISESILLLQLILEDIRADCSERLLQRAEKALDIAEYVNMPVLVENIGEFIDEAYEGRVDDGFFIARYEMGGYMGLEEIHNLEHTIIDKSEELKNSIYILNNPECKFKDWDIYEM